MFIGKDKINRINYIKEMRDDELLEIFILIEENTMSAKVEAITRYKRFFSLTDSELANKKMKEDYQKFKSK